MSSTDDKDRHIVNQEEKPPKDLSPEAAKWWQEVFDGYEFDTGRLALLNLAAHALSRAENARQTLKKDGPFYRDAHKVMRPHPATLVLRNAESSFTQLFRALKLDKIDDEAASDAEPYVDKRSMNWKLRNAEWTKSGRRGDGQ